MFKSLMKNDPYEWEERDWKLRYNGQIIGVKIKGVVFPRKFVTVYDSNTNGKIIKKVKHTDLYSKNTSYSHLSNCILDFPDSCYVNLNTTAVYINVVRKKSQKRSVNFGDLIFNLAFQYVGDYYALNSTDVEDGVKAMFNPNYPSFVQSEILIRNGSMFSCAFDKEFCLGPHFNEEGLAIEYDKVYIARYHKRRLYLVSKYSFLKEKLQHLTNMEVQIV